MSLSMLIGVASIRSIFGETCSRRVRDILVCDAGLSVNDYRYTCILVCDAGLSVNDYRYTGILVCDDSLSMITDIHVY